MLAKVRQLRQQLTAKIKSERGENGHWNGYLSSSAISTAVAITALDSADHENAKEKVETGVSWLCRNINTDGGWGDSPESPSNLSAVLLARSALNRRRERDDVKQALKKSETWLQQTIGGTDTETIKNAILDFYGKDRTFSIPILTALALGNNQLDRQTWKQIPPLPFELAMLPNSIFKFLKLPVVSYAIPALIAVGLVRHQLAGSHKNIVYKLRELSVRRVLKILEKMQPENGGFLEAPPLTAFVTMSLYAAGHGEKIVDKGVDFLHQSYREDGSWPIDTSLNLWLTSLATKALDEDLDQKTKQSLTTLYQQLQFKAVHPFTQAAPGGWGWNNSAGSTPDGDDTSGALIALSIVDSKLNDTVRNGLNWLLNLANSDGGIPTFCRGWGHLPFDRSCPDISAHALLAFDFWKTKASGKLGKRLENGSKKIVHYLTKTIDRDGAWSPLWFGDQDSTDHRSRVYGTAAVLEGLQHHPDLEIIDQAINYLKRAQNSDGGWGGEPGASSKIETTSRAVTALSYYPHAHKIAIDGGKWLLENLDSDHIKSSPIGLYFASLWYDEKLYPLLFALPAIKRLELILEKNSA